MDGRVFGWLVGASGVSNLADGLLKVVLPLLAVQTTDSPVLVAAVAAAFRLPWLVVALPAGVLVDRVDRRRVMLVANACRAVAVAGLVVDLTSGGPTLLVLVAVALAVGTAEVGYDTAAQAIVPMVVPSGGLARANGRLFAVELTTSELVGPPLGGALVAAGAVTAAATPAGAWLVALGLLLLGVRGRYRAAGESGDRRGWRSELATGLRYLWRHDVLRVMAVVVGLFNLASQALFGILVLYVVGPRSVLGLGETAYGLLLACVAVGSVLGFLVLAPRLEARLGRSRTLGIGLAGAGLGMLTPAVATNPWVVGASLLVSGAGLATWNVVAVSLRQRVVPAHLLGRVTSAFRLLAWGTAPAGALLGGLLAESAGVRVTVAAAGLVALLLVVAVRRLSDDVLDAAEAATPDAGTSR